MKVAAAIIWLVVALTTAYFALVLDARGRMGGVVESQETHFGGIRVRIDAHHEVGFWIPGQYYVFATRLAGSSQWREIMTFRHDDPVPIPKNNVRFVSDQTAFVFMGWMYAVTTDGGATWTVWDAEADLPNWVCCNYGLIADARIAPDGTGVMTLAPIPHRSGEVPLLRTSDFGRHWNPLS